MRLDRDAVDPVRSGTFAEAAKAARQRLTSGLPLLFAISAITISAASADVAISLDQDIWSRVSVGGGWDDLKPRLADVGIAVALTDIEEVQDNAAGGVRRGSGYDGATFFSLSADLDTLLGWRDGDMTMAAGALRGHGVAQFDVENLLTTSNIETQPETRLFDLYLEQRFFEGRLTLRAGQMLPSDEFVASHYATPLMNSSFGWPALLGADLPGDDPVGLVSTPAIWGKYEGSGPVSAELGLYQGTSSTDAGPLEARASTSNGDGVLLFAEAAYTIRPDAEGTLPTVLKLGGWYHSAEFDDLALNRDGQPLALFGGIARRHAGDHGAYAVFDRLLYVVPETSDHGLGGFLRVAAAPGDRNLISLYVDLGLNYKGLLPSRGGDTLALGLAWARIGDAARDNDIEIRQGAGSDYPVRDGEAVGELTYQFEAAPWWTIQPDLQYVVHPGAGGPDPEFPADNRRIPNAVVIGLRTSVRF